MTQRRAIRRGEILAIDPKAIQRDADGFFLLMAPEVPKNHYKGNTACVYVRGPLDHHDEGCGDNYDSILCRTEEAFEHEGIDTVVLSIDSPGGVVSGLNETIASLQQMKVRYGKSLFAFVDEMATSAAYALSCACDEIIIPKSGICGSIGVISTMADQVAFDKKQGFNFVTITSGARKADGHPHVPISDDAVAAESARVRNLAKQFFAIVNGSRGLSLKQIEGLQAGIFLGPEALKIGLVDGVMGPQEFFSELQTTNFLASNGESGSDLPQVQKYPGSQASLSKDKDMALALSVLIKKTKAALAKEKDLKKRKALTAALEAYTKTKYKLEEETKEESEEEEEEEEGGNDTDRREEDDGDDDEDMKDKDGEEEEEEEEDEEEERAAATSVSRANALVPALRRLTGKSSPAAMLGAINSAFAKAIEFDRISKDVKDLKAKEKSRELDALVADGARRGQFPNPKFAVALKSQGLKAVKAYLSATKPGTFLTTEDSKHVSPDGKIIDPARISPTDLGTIPITEDMQKAAMAAHYANPKIPVEKFLENMQRSEFTRMNGKGTY